MTVDIFKNSEKDL